MLWLYYIEVNQHKLREAGSHSHPIKRRVKKYFFISAAVSSSIYYIMAKEQAGSQ